MNGVIKRTENNTFFNIASREILKETFTAKYNCVLPRTPSVRPKSEIYTPKRDAEHPRPFQFGDHPPPPPPRHPCNSPEPAPFPTKRKEDPTTDPGDSGNRAYILLDLCESIIPQFNKVPLQFLQLMGQTYIQCCFSNVRKLFQLKNIKFDSLI